MHYEHILMLSLLCLTGSVFSVFCRRKQWPEVADWSETREYLRQMALGIALLVLGSCWLVLWGLIQIYPLSTGVLIFLLVLFAMPAAASAMAWVWNHQRKHRITALCKVED